MAPPAVIIDLLDSDSDDAEVVRGNKSAAPKSCVPLKQSTNILDDDPIISQPFSSPQPDLPTRNVISRSRRRDRVPFDLISLSSSDDFDVPKDARKATLSKPNPRAHTKKLVPTDLRSSDDELECIDSIISSQKGHAATTAAPPSRVQLSRYSSSGFSSKTLEVLASLENSGVGGMAEERSMSSCREPTLSSFVASAVGQKPGIRSNPKPKFSRKTSTLGLPYEDEIEKLEPLKAASAEENALEKANRKRQREEDQTSKKRQKAEERATAKKQKEEDQAIMSVNKLKYSHAETVTEMILDISESIFDAPVGERLQAFLDGLGVNYKCISQPVDNAITWRRFTSAVWDDEQGIFMPGPPVVRKEEYVLILVNATEFAVLAKDDASLDSHVHERKQFFPACKVIYLIEGLAKYIKKKKSEETRAFTQAIRSRMVGGNRGGKSSSSRCSAALNLESEAFDVDCLEDALLRLQVVHDCFVFQSVGYMDSAEVISSYTQHISSVPYKKARSNISKTTNFCMDVGQVKSGSLPSDIYSRMLQEVRLCTTSVADTIQNAFPSALNLYSAFERQGEEVLRTLPVLSKNTGLSTGRALGPAMSKRMAKIWTCMDEWALES